ncbi:hypothetical protein BHE74_00018779 [Ensete ventricosum]|nr:hypothetical protein BHE74_00018779 [Ensete ventricosum]RZS28257.1 hypothetical protein BHM03_00061827 [Ensete ventricosum]
MFVVNELNELFRTSTSRPHESFVRKGGGCGGSAYDGTLQRVDARARAAEDPLARKGSAHRQTTYGQGRWSYAHKALAKVTPTGKVRCSRHRTCDRLHEESLAMRGGWPPAQGDVALAIASTAYSCACHIGGDCK